MSRTPRVPPALARRPFRADDAVRDGLLTPRQLQGGAWRRLFTGVYVHADVALCHTLLCQALGLVLPDDVVFSGYSAACLLGANAFPPGVDEVRVLVEVTAARPRHLHLGGRMRERRSDLLPIDVTRAAGLPVTSPVRTAFDLARRCSLDDGVIAVDALLWTRRVTIAEIAAYLLEYGERRHGRRRLSRVLELAAVGAESPMETLMRLALVRSGLPAPVLQHEVRGAMGGRVAVLDCAYPEARLDIEYDGGYHFDKATALRDLRRQNALRALGWTIFRFTTDDVRTHPGRMAAQVKAALGWREAA